MSLPLFWLAAKRVTKPKIVGECAFPSSPADTRTHAENMKAAR